MSTIEDSINEPVISISEPKEDLEPTEFDDSEQLED